MHNRWNKPIKEARKLKLQSGSTIIENFLIVCSEYNSEIACFDEYLGALSYSDMLKAIIAIAIKSSDFPESQIGVMMPASAGAYIAYFGLLLAGKIPVMINWTQGVRELRLCVENAKVNRVLSSSQFVEHLSRTHGPVDYPFNFIYMEEVRPHLSWWDKCRIGLYSKLPPSWLLRIFGIKHLQGNDIAVILFTSGTEKSPKGVPLTHKNLIANQEAYMEFFNPTQEDVMLGFLPPFHAYGFNCCGLFPLLVGLPIVFVANPLNPKKSVEFIETKEVTFLGSTPVFFDYILKTAKKEGASLNSLRLVVIGGDAFKDSLYKEIKHLYPHISLWQGYGATECSPVITITAPDSSRDQKCVGMPISGIEILILSEETRTPLPLGQQGLIVVRGSSVFSGYLNDTTQQGFISLGREQWYVTGDIGYIDPHGDLFLEGRLSRFVKIGGEMISLEAVEDILRQGFGESPGQEQTSFIVCPVPKNKVQLCLFTTFSTTLHEVNDILKNAETSKIVKVSYIHQVKSIPLLGVGKPNYASLNALAASLFA
ncbi:AMP-binding protein [Candidatus Chlamydia sanziniae]|uniref:Acylglycerophosphoethanolamine acyltransferase n=1 Tax=Candidatus Chlamydia sanziniae TaxID=1806891 RepID=A0A1A9HUP2_9CHLA|nr:AMP-binding protein [Candidatus Chlamydia sanziniae]ANH78720.1 Acylglycerophosphoethanolamine acyltransferase [Candidatus Chlamydia sanziniae]